MAFVSELFDSVRDLLNDADDTQVPFLTKKLYLNRGIARMWPQVWRVATVNIVVLSGTYDYPLPVAAADGLILSVELLDSGDDISYHRFPYWDFLSGDEDLSGTFSLTTSPDSSLLLGQTIAVRYAAPVAFITSSSYAASQSEVWTGPDRAMGIPTNYAMSLISARKVDDRQDTLRYSTTVASNGVTDRDIMDVSQMWMGQFELELAAFERPLPPSRD